MNVGSLFSGIGGIDLGLERAGMRVVWQVECDPYARAVLRKHWPAAALYNDVRSVGAANLAPVDLVCGGFPCQDISNAGKRVGIDGERSGLWSEYARIVRELRPRYVLVENVAPLLVRGMERVLRDLAACGYDAEWDCFPAAAFGAPHRRDRLFIVAHTYSDRRDARRDRTDGHEGTALGQPRALRERQAVADADRGRLEKRGERDGWTTTGKQAPFGRDASRCGAPSLADADEQSGHEGWTGNAAQEQGGRHADRGGVSGDVADSDLARLEGRLGGELRERTGKRPSRTSGALPDAAIFRSDDGRRVELAESSRSPGRSGHWLVEPDVGRVAHGVPSRVDRLRCLGNSVVPQVAQWIGEQIMRHAKEEAP